MIGEQLLALPDGEDEEAMQRHRSFVVSEIRIDGLSRISAGTPGKAKTRHVPPARGKSMSMPGAVPCGLGTTRLPAGNIA